MLARDKLGRFVPYIYYLTPFLIYNTAPLAVMVATLICFGLLAKRHELTAFRASGVSLYRLASPVLVFRLAVERRPFSRSTTTICRKRTAARTPSAMKSRAARRAQYLRPDRQWTFGLRKPHFLPPRVRFEGHDVLRHQRLRLARGNPSSCGGTSPPNALTGAPLEASGCSSGVGCASWTAFIPPASNSSTAGNSPDIVEPPDYFLKEDRHDQQMNWRQLQAYIVDLTQKRLRYDPAASPPAQETCFSVVRFRHGAAGGAVRDADRPAGRPGARRLQLRFDDRVLRAERAGGATGPQRAAYAADGGLGALPDLRARRRVFVPAGSPRSRYPPRTAVLLSAARVSGPCRR